MISNGVQNERALPGSISYFKLNEDGSYTEATPVEASVYVDDVQVSCLWDADMSRYIRSKYGPYVGVMHTHRAIIRAPRGQSLMYVLGDCAR